MKLEPFPPDWLFVCFLSTWHWNAANRHSWYGLYYETRNYFNCPSNSLPVAVNKTISFSSSLTHVVVDKGAAPSDQGWWKAVWGLQPLPSPGPRGLQPARGCCWGRDWPLSPLLQPVLTQLGLHRPCPSPLHLLSFTFQCCLCGNHFRMGRGKSFELGDLRETSSLWIISRLKYLCEVWRFFSPWAGSCPVKGFKTEKQLNPKEQKRDICARENPVDFLLRCADL